ncbi:NAD-dependent epimerase/dehydratase family protein [Saccharothrix violaceirubra]|uniref:CDP-paratose 2-epimerase n=1 Tax=Saccharothrix violaceirubra TaxID=413306 RepID=A0A7W7T2H9_9PSEU|nr:NAD-dependent epimerase/dehydratase family protein [Saccharothrix violaceirubra]MBB4965407.1 CDP-paratose 2-epimerase [Saccharothrix violaceirubra]
MDIAVVTGPGGPVGAAAVRALSTRFDLVVGHDVDRDDPGAVDRVLREYGTDVRLVVHTAAHPGPKPAPDSFDRAAPVAVALLDAVLAHCPDAVVVVESTVDVHGDLSGSLPLVESTTRWDLDPTHPWYEHGVDSTVFADRVDRDRRAVGVLAADLAAQHYARRHGLAVGVVRTGPVASDRYGLPARLVRAALTGTFTIRGHGGKQVRDVLDVSDLVEMFWHYYRAPRPGEVYQAGGGRARGHSVLEVIGTYEHLSGREVRFEYLPHTPFAEPRWWLTDTRGFRRDYPGWRPTRALADILTSADAFWRTSVDAFERT